MTIIVALCIGFLAGSLYGCVVGYVSAIQRVRRERQDW